MDDEMERIRATWAAEAVKRKIRRKMRGAARASRLDKMNSWNAELEPTPPSRFYNGRKKEQADDPL